MSCDLPVRQCLAWHFQPHLSGAKLVNSKSIRARCPACDRPRALSISEGDHERVVLNCFGCESNGEITRLLIASGISPGCLPRPKRDNAELIERALNVMRSSERPDLRLYLTLLGYRHWPVGKKLIERAAEIGLSKTAAYRWKQSGALNPGTPVPITPRKRLSSSPVQGAAEDPEKSRYRDQVPISGLNGSCGKSHYRDKTQVTSHAPTGTG